MGPGDLTEPASTSQTGWPTCPADFSIVNQPGADSYPITGYSWALVYTHQPNQATGQKLATMLDWLTHHGQA